MPHAQPSIIPGRQWLDTNAKPIHAHGGSLLFHDGTFYFYGENKELTVPGSKVWHYGVRCYSSTDLYSWHDLGIILSPVTGDPSNPLHPSRIMDRPHILYNERTRKFVMWVKFAGTAENPSQWEVQYMGIAVADAITGPFELVTTIRPLGMYSGDFDLYKEARDGKAYFIFDRVHTEIVIADLTGDYLDVTGNYSSHFPQPGPPLAREAPAFFKFGHRYFMITSGTTGYEPNQADCGVAALVHGPWTSLGDPCAGDVKKTTFDSQISSVFVHPHKKNLVIAVADRWAPLDNSKASYVWLPIEVREDGLRISWRDEWRIEEFK